MSHTVVGIFEFSKQAQEAKAYLLANGVNNANVDISTGAATNDSVTTNGKDEDTGDRINNFFSNIFGTDDEETTSSHAEAGRRGTIVTVHAQTEKEALMAVEALDNYGAVDVNEFADKARTGDSADNGVIQVIEEELQVGKREVETGGVRLRSRIVERPVEESIRLRQEHVSVERKPVNRPATEADFANFKQGTLEMTETAEIAVVAKEAHVVEEISLSKEVSEKEETIKDSVRHTEVDTENITGSDYNSQDSDKH